MRAEVRIGDRIHRWFPFTPPRSFAQWRDFFPPLREVSHELPRPAPSFVSLGFPSTTFRCNGLRRDQDRGANNHTQIIIYNTVPVPVYIAQFGRAFSQGIIPIITPFPVEGQGFRLTRHGQRTMLLGLTETVPCGNLGTPGSLMSTYCGSGECAHCPGAASFVACAI